MASLEECCHGMIPQDQGDFPLSYYVLNDDWKWEIIEQYVPSNVCDKIQGLRIPVDLDSVDFPSWTLCSDGMFTLKSAYQIICSEAVAAQV